MRHLHEERLAGLALGEPDPLALPYRVHLVFCRHCAGRLADLRNLVATGRAGQPYPLREPRPATLAAIQAELAGDRAPVPSTSRPARADEAAQGLGTARRRTPAYVPRLVAAAAVLAVAVGGTVWYRVATDAQVVARATLTPLPDKSGEGRARLLRKDGAEELAIDVTGAAPAGVFEELWLINTDGRRMISLGIVPANGRRSYPVPAAGAALKGYTIVDISLEPYDGIAAHSHNSVLRGTLS